MGDVIHILNDCRGLEWKWVVHTNYRKWRKRANKWNKAPSSIWAVCFVMATDIPQTFWNNSYDHSLRHHSNKNKTSGKDLEAYSCHSFVAKSAKDKDANVQVQWIQKHGNLKTFFFVCTRWATFIGMNWVLFWSTGSISCRISLGDERSIMWSSSLSKEASLAMSNKQKEGNMTSLGFIVVHWIFDASNMARKLAMVQLKEKKKTTSWCMYGYLERMQVSKYLKVCFANV